VHRLHRVAAASYADWLTYGAGVTNYLAAPRELMLIGVVPQSVQSSLHLSRPVREAIPMALKAIVDMLARAGETAILRPDSSRDAHVWSNAAG
jgi:hypothetical protein